MSLNELHSELQRAERRLAEMVDRRADQEQARTRADATERLIEARQQAREDAERRREIQAKYADAFASHGSLVPAPIDDESPGRYRKRLFDSLQHKLPPTHDLATIRSDDLTSGPMRRNFETMLLEAATAEGATPSPANLPRDGSMVTRVRVDPNTNARRTEFFGRESFIRGLSQEPRRVLRFIGRDGVVLHGPPMERVR